MYLVIQVTPNTRPEPKNLAKLSLLKLSAENKNDVPTDCLIHSVHWMSRR
jgi:hypothetical protein